MNNKEMKREALEFIERTYFLDGVCCMSDERAANGLADFARTFEARASDAVRLAGEHLGFVGATPADLIREADRMSAQIGRCREALQQIQRIVSDASYRAPEQMGHEAWGFVLHQIGAHAKEGLKP